MVRQIVAQDDETHLPQLVVVALLGLGVHGHGIVNGISRGLHVPCGFKRY